MEKALSFRVTGVVQGVGFRLFVQTAAQKLGLTGWVKNKPDGSVAGVVQGDAGLLQAFTQELRMGNRWSAVSGLELGEEPFSADRQHFEILQ
jgi:acylphosphatase